MSEHDESGQDDAEPGIADEVEDGELLPRREVMSAIDLGDGGPIYSLPVEPNN